MRFSKYNKLKKSQPELDFVDIDPDYDTPVYIDPYAIEIRDDTFAEDCNFLISHYFRTLIDAVRNGNDGLALQLLSNLREPPDTFLVVSKGKPQGRGVGKIQARQLLKALKRSKAVKTGVLSDLSETALFVEGFGPDKISYLTTNIIRSKLAAYTQQQCLLYGIKLHQVANLPPAWTAEKSKWVSEYLSLPKIGDKAITLVPKYLVRRVISLDSQEIYNKQITNYLVAEHEQPGDALCRTLSDGRLRVDKKDVRKKYPKSKEFIFDIVSKNPNLLDSYKSIKGAIGALTNYEISGEAKDSHIAGALIKELQALGTGKEDAYKYQGIIVGIITLLFYPGLSNPSSEHPINEGMKRIDILYNNTGISPFFERMIKSNRVDAIEVPVECKNYNGEVGNPEIDQLLVRLGRKRGWLGFLVCRKVENKTLLLKRCRDAASDGQGYIITMDDDDLITLLSAVTELNNKGIDNWLSDRFRELTN